MASPSPGCNCESCVRARAIAEVGWVWRALPRGCWCQHCGRPGAHYCDKYQSKQIGRAMQTASSEEER